MQKHIYITFIGILLCSFTTVAQPVLIPYPQQISYNGKTYPLGNTVAIKQIGITTPFIYQFLQKQLNGQFKIKTIATPKKSNLFTITCLVTSEKKIPAEGYNLSVEPAKVTITASTEVGIFHGLQTLLQLVDTVSQKPAIIGCSITDSPRFAYRGMHLDVSRHFFSVDFIKQYIDFLAAHKYNTFHWHLTDDQGWRIQIKRYPQLSQVASCRNQTLIGKYGSGNYDGKKYCGIYTQEQVKDVVAYAKQNYITIIPEIEMPGHALAALTAYPYLGCTKGPYQVAETWGVFDDVFCAGNDSTFQFLENVLAEVIQLFPSKYIHIGGDECPKTRWKHCPLCQARMKKLGLKDEHELQSYFINRIEKYLNNKGRSIIGWDEILEGGLAPNATVMSWRGEEGGVEAANQNHNVIMTPGGWCYFDHSQSKNEDSLTIGGYTPLEKVYNYNPIPEHLDASKHHYILGAQANLWTEYITNSSKVEYMLFPRLSALSEVLWTNLPQKNATRFMAQIPKLFERYKKMNINFSEAFYDINNVVKVENNTVLWEASSKLPNTQLQFLKTNSSTLAWQNYAAPITISNSCQVFIRQINPTTHTVMGDTVSQQFYINQATAKPITVSIPPSKSYNTGGEHTLNDGVQNTEGLQKSSQFLGFNTGNVTVTLDLQNPVLLQNIIVHGFKQNASWIYAPDSAMLSYSMNGIEFSEPSLMQLTSGSNPNYRYEINPNVEAQFIRINFMMPQTITEGNPGAGNKPWLFLDEIEVNKKE